MLTLRTSWPRAGSLLLGVLAVILGLGGCQRNITDESIVDISLTDLRKVIDEHKSSKDKDVLLLVDPRSPRDFAKGHLPDARNMQLPSIPDRKGELDKRLERFSYVVVYGEDRGSAVAKALAKRMMGVGYDNIYMFGGGIEEWRRAGMVLVESEPPAPKP